MSDDIGSAAPEGAGSVPTPAAEVPAESLAPGAALAEIERTRGAAFEDAKHPYTNGRHPEHGRAVARMNALYQRAYDSPEAQAGPNVEPPSVAQGMTADEARAEIARRQGEIAKNPDDPYVNPGHPQHAASVRDMKALYDAAYPEPNANEAAARDPNHIADPESYDVPLRAVQLDTEDSLEAIQAGMAEARTWMAELGFNPGEAQDAIKAYNEAFQGYKAGAPALLDADAEGRNMGILNRIWGEETENKVAAAQRALARIDKNGRVTEFLELTGLGNDPSLIRNFAAAAERNGW